MKTRLHLGLQGRPFATFFLGKTKRWGGMKMITPRFYAWAAATMLACGCPGSSAVEAGTEVPFKMYGHIMIAACSAGGLELRCMVDTGALPSMIDERIAERLDLRDSRQVGLVAYDRRNHALVTYLPALQFGAIRTAGVPVLIGDLSFLRGFLGVTVDAVIGIDILKQSNFLIDFERKVLVFAAESTLEKSVPFQRVLKSIVLEAVAGSRSLLMVVDTGAPEIALFDNETGLGLPDLHFGSVRKVRHYSGESLVRCGHLDRLAVGPDKWKNVPVDVFSGHEGRFSGVDGLLPLSCLKLKRVHFDFDRNVMSWSR